MRVSSPPRLTRGPRLLVLASAAAAAAAAVAAVAVTVRRRRAEDGDASPSLTGMPALEPAPGDQPPAPPAPATPAAVAGPAAGTSPAGAATSRTAPNLAQASPARLSRADLYRQAQAAGVKGRSKMSKTQLEQALRKNQT